MIIIVCLDDNNGMMFNHRRQSRDKLLIKDIIGEIGEKKIFMDSYSEPLFSGYEEKVCLSSDPLNNAEDGAYCFIENQPITEIHPQTEGFWIYRWNRVYPADVKFDVDLSSAGFSLASVCDFTGSSHDKITKEIYRR